MKKSVIAAFLVAFVLSLVYCPQISSAAGEKLKVYIFYSPHCGYCKRSAPEFDAVEAKYGGSVDIVRVDVTKERALSSKYNVTKLPTIVVGNSRISGYSSGLAARIEKNILAAAPGVMASAPNGETGASASQDQNSTAVSSSSSSTIGALSQTVSGSTITGGRNDAASAPGCNNAQSASVEAGCVSTPASQASNAACSNASNQAGCLTAAQVGETVKKYCNKGIFNKIKNFFRKITDADKGDGGFFGKIKNFFKKLVTTVKSIFTCGTSNCSQSQSDCNNAVNGNTASDCNTAVSGCNSHPGCNGGACRNAAAVSAPASQPAAVPAAPAAPTAPAAAPAAEEQGRGGMSGE